MDLADIPSAAAAARELVAKETRLDLLFNNAYYLLLLVVDSRGVNDYKNLKTAQGYEMHWVWRRFMQADLGGSCRWTLCFYKGIITAYTEYCQRASHFYSRGLDIEYRTQCRSKGDYQFRRCQSFKSQYACPLWSIESCMSLSLIPFLESFH